MLLVKIDNDNNLNDLVSISLNQVGKYLVFDSKDEKKLHGLNYISVPDGINYPLAYKQEDKISNVNFGGEVLQKNKPIMIAGPCATESYEQIDETASFMSSLGIKHFRSGNFKPRTNAYSFQGMEREGLEICREVCDKYGLELVSEVKDLSNFDDVQELADIVQVGSKCMYDVGVLREVGKQDKSVLLKRHFGATLIEFVQAADFILCQGNENLTLCERGIRSFENSTRFTLDSSGIEWLKYHTWLPIIGDPSHAMGHRYGIFGLSMGILAQGVNGLIIEVHPNPESAKSDSNQQLSFDQFKNLYDKYKKFSTFLNEIY